MILGLILNYAGVNAVKMLFCSAVLNGVLAPPLIALVVLLSSSNKVMGIRANPPILKWLGWATAVIMAAVDVTMFVTM
jgi:Mn2+/Fe2+ NRAMP family transporter